MGFIIAYLTFDTSIVFIIMSWLLLFNKQYLASKVLCGIGIFILIAYFLIQQILFGMRERAFQIAQKTMTGFEKGKYTPYEVVLSLQKLLQTQKKVNHFCLDFSSGQMTFEFIMQSVQALRNYRCKN